MTRAPTLLSISLLLLCSTVTAQFTDDFSDGDFSTNPAWDGEASLFTVNGSFQLQSNGPGQTDTASLYTGFSPDFEDTITWDFYWRMAFSPSGNNTGRVYLCASSPNLTSSANQGYYLRIGNSGSDTLLFYRANGSSSTLLASGITDYSSNPELTVRVIRYPNGLWELFSDPAAGTNYGLEASVMDTVYTSCSRFGVWCKYTSSNSTKFYFDDFNVTGTPFVDDEAPTILSAEPISGTQLVLEFSEPLNGTTAQTTTNYSVDNGVGMAQTATITNAEATQVTLDFTNAFPIAQISTVTVSGVEDTTGNAITSEQETFLYFQFSTPDARSVVINEFMADPSPAVGLPELEFVEIHNPGTDYYDLSGATLSDAAGTATAVGDAFIGPGEYVILCAQADTSTFAAFGKTLGMSSFPSLNNDADNLTLVINGVTTDALSYTTAWYNDPDKADGGYSLEQINPTSPCTGIPNWMASQHADGGTPGQQNSVFDTSPDTSQPEVSALTVTSATQLTINFTETMDSASLASAVYSITPTLSIAAVTVASPGLLSTTLDLGSAIDSTVIYKLAISGPTDCIGNPLDSDTLTFGLGATPHSFDIIINELYPQPTEDAGIPAVEFVELYNRSDKLLRLQGARIGDRSSSSEIETITLLPGAYLVICDDNFEGDFNGVADVAVVTSMPSLNNSDDDISLTLGSRTLDAVSYKDSWYGDDEKAGGGFTLERISPDNLCGLSANWLASEASEGGTPGTENSVFDSSVNAVEPALVAAQFESLNEVSLVFDRSMDTLSLHSASIAADNTPLSIQSFSADRSALTAVSVPTFERGTLYQLTIDSASDCAGKRLPVTTYELYLHAQGDILINEVLFNPRGSGTDFVELYNRTPNSINLQGWAMGYYDTNDSLRFNVVTDEPLLIEPQGYVALNEDGDDLLFNYPAAVAQNLFEMNLPSYSNDAGSVIVFDQFELNMDRFDYSDDLHFALIDDQNGVSLERLDADRATDDPGNWHSASSEDNYATPGYLNSQQYPSVAALATFSLSAEYISPDNDGYQDVVNIEYQVPEPELSVTVSVYTDKGILVKEVASNLLIGNEGSITWDGTNDQGEKARTGIHVILVETFSLGGERNRYRLPVVVASRLN